MAGTQRCQHTPLDRRLDEQRRRVGAESADREEGSSGEKETDTSIRTKVEQVSGGVGTLRGTGV